MTVRVQFTSEIRSRLREKLILGSGCCSGAADSLLGRIFNKIHYGVGLRRVVAAFVEGVATQDSPHSFGRPNHDTVLFHGLNEVATARGLVAAGRTDQRAEGDLIKSNRQD